MLALGMAYEPAGSITVANTGIYEVHYSCTLSTMKNTTLTVAVRQDGTNITEAVQVRQAMPGQEVSFSGSVILPLGAGASIDMAVSAPLAVAVSLQNGTSAMLTIKKLDN